MYYGEGLLSEQLLYELEKQIQDLREKIRKEPQLKRQIEFSNQVRQLEKEVKELKND